MSRLWNRIQHLYQHEGFISLLRAIINDISSRLPFEIETFYIRECEIMRRDEFNWLPKIDDYQCKILTKTTQLNEIINDGYNLSSLKISSAKYRLKNGAVAFFIFIRKKLVGWGWVALTEQAKNTFNDYPYKIDFGNGEACLGSVWTHPKYRRQGLLRYLMYKREQYLLDMGIARSYMIIRKYNIASQRAVDKRGDRICAEARYLRIFNRKFWKETRINKLI